VHGNGSRLANVTHYTPPSLDKLNDLIMKIPFYLDVFENDVDMFDRSNMKIFQNLTEHSCYGKFNFEHIFFGTYLDIYRSPGFSNLPEFF
jgi:hypothetical protein